jgi:hypothetical protein
MKSIQGTSLYRLAYYLLLALLWSGVPACQRQINETRPDSTSGSGAIVGVNYTNNGIQWFTVDGAAGARLGTYSGGGGFVCCASYPKTWKPNFNVTVKWARSDRRRPGSEEWEIKKLEKVVAVEKYVEEGNVYVLFFPNDEVKVFVSVVGVGNPDFPTRPGYPEDAPRVKEVE